MTVNSEFGIFSQAKVRSIYLIIPSQPLCPRQRFHACAYVWLLTTGSYMTDDVTVQEYYCVITYTFNFSNFVRHTPFLG